MMYLNKFSIFAASLLLALSLCACGGGVEGGADSAWQDHEHEAAAQPAHTPDGFREALAAVPSQDESLSPFTIVPGDQGDNYAATVYYKGEEAGVLAITGDALFALDVRMMPTYARDHATAAIRYLAPTYASDIGAHLLVTPDFGTYRAYDAEGYRFLCYSELAGLDSKYHLLALKGDSFSDYQEGKAWVLQIDT